MQPDMAQVLADYSTLPIEARTYMAMARMIDPKKADAACHALVANIRRNNELLAKLRGDQ